MLDSKWPWRAILLNFFCKTLQFYIVWYDSEKDNEKRNSLSCVDFLLFVRSLNRVRLHHYVPVSVFQLPCPLPSYSAFPGPLQSLEATCPGLLPWRVVQLVAFGVASSCCVLLGSPRLICWLTHWSPFPSLSLSCFPSPSLSCLPVHVSP